MLEGLEELFLKSYKEKYNLSDEQVEEIKGRFIDYTQEGIIDIAVAKNLLPVIHYVVENKGDVLFILNDRIANDDDDDDIVGDDLEPYNMLNVAAEAEALDIINYFLDRKIFTVNQRAHENCKTALHSAVENNNIKAVELLLQKGADINAEFFNNLQNITFSSLDQVIHLSNEGGAEIEYMEMAKLLVKHGVQIRTNIDQLVPSAIKDFLLSIKKLDDSYNSALSNGKNDFCDIYENLKFEDQEIWFFRKAKEGLGNFNIVAEFITKKISEKNIIKYNEFAGLRAYDSLSEPKKDLLKILLKSKGITDNDFVKIDSYIKNHFFEIAGIAKSLENSVFELLGGAKEHIVPTITQYLQFEDTSIKIAGEAINDDC